MNSIYICFNLKSAPVTFNSNELFEKDYQLTYKPLIQFLYSHPQIKFSFSFSGQQLQFFKKSRKEFLTLLKELVERKQVEIIGGAFYQPLLPLLYTTDRNGQIDLLTAEIRQTLGKRPRGISLFSDTWESSIINSISGMEYILLDESVIQDDKKHFLPLITTYLGKSTEIFPTYEKFCPKIEESPEEFLQNLKKEIEKSEKKENYFQLNPNRIVNINISHTKMNEINKSKWLYSLTDFLEKNQIKDYLFETPNQYKKNERMRISTAIQTGWNFSNSIFSDEVELNEQKFKTIYVFLEKNPSSYSLYNRMMYVNMLVNQYKGDKIRKKLAREKLWKAQEGKSLLWNNIHPSENFYYRQNSYKLLMDVEKILREDKNFKENITSFDYNADGLNEYVCRMNNYFAYVSLYGGMICELDLVKNHYNYCDTLLRKKQFDNEQDNYFRGFFVDHLLTNENFNDYIENKTILDGVFSKVLYEEVKFSQNHREIQLKARAVYSKTKQQVYLRKKYIFNSTGIYVQYIIKNESDKKLNAKFICESNLSNLIFDDEKNYFYSIKFADNIETFDEDSSKEILKEKLSVVKLSDEKNGVAFVFEPNEECGYYYSQIPIYRENKKNEKCLVQKTSISSLFWDLQIETGMETEKNITFSIIPVKKSKK